MEHFSKKVLASFLGIVILFSVVVAPRPANAQFGGIVFESNPITLLHHLTTSIATAATAALQSSINVKEFILDPLGWAVSKIALQSVTKSVVNWINGGFHGSPAFVTDLNSNLIKVSDTAAEGFLNQLTSNAAIKSPFQDVLTQAVRANYYISTARDGFALKNPYTLNQATQNDQAFLSGDFNQGGWGAWLSSVSHQANNPFGAKLLQDEALANQANAAISSRQSELNWGKGFLSWRGSCGASGQADSGSAQGAACKVDDDCGGTLACISGHCAVDPSLDTPVSLSSGDTCLGYNIQTPGSVISDQLTKVLGTSVDSLVTADEFNEIIGALMGQLVNNVLGSTGLSGVSQPSAGGGRSYINQAADPSQITSGQSSSSNIATTFITTVANQKAQIQQYQANWQKISDAATAAKTSLQSSTCTPSADTIISSQVQPVLTQATTAIANATSAITSLDQIITSLTSSSAASQTDQATAVSQASATYQSLLGGSTLPSASDVTYANDQSLDTTGTVTTPSLFTQMTALATQAKCGG